MAGDVRRAVRELGATDPRAVKLLTRTGMGWCQGRICAAPTLDLTAHLTGRPTGVEDAIALTRRPFAHPVPLGALAHLDVPDPSSDVSDPTSHISDPSTRTGEGER